MRFIVENGEIKQEIEEISPDVQKYCCPGYDIFANK